MSLQDTLEQIMRRLDKIERDLEELKPPEYSSDVFTGFANPTASVVLVPVNGAATTAMRSDAAPQLSQAIAPTWTALHTFQRSGLTVLAHQTGAAAGVPDGYDKEKGYPHTGFYRRQSKNREKHPDCIHR